MKVLISGEQVARFTLRDDRTMFLFVWAVDDAGAVHAQIRTERHGGARGPDPS